CQLNKEGPVPLKSVAEFLLPAKRHSVPGLIPSYRYNLRLSKPARPDRYRNAEFRTWLLRQCDTVQNWAVKESIPETCASLQKLAWSCKCRAPVLRRNMSQ